MKTCDNEIEKLKAKENIGVHKDFAEYIFGLQIKLSEETRIKNEYIATTENVSEECIRLRAEVERLKIKSNKDDAWWNELSGNYREMLSDRDNWRMRAEAAEKEVERLKKTSIEAIGATLEHGDIYGDDNIVLMRDSHYKELQAKLSRYEGAVEVSTVTKIKHPIFNESICQFIIPKELEYQKVKVLVMKEEV